MANGINPNDINVPPNMAFPMPEEQQNQRPGYVGLFYSAIKSRVVGANETDNARYQAEYGTEAPKAYYQRVLSWGYNKATSAVRNVLPTPVVAVADFIMGQQADPNAPQVANIDFMDQLKQLMANPASKKIASYVIPYIQSSIDALIFANSENERLLNTLDPIRAQVGDLQRDLNADEAQFQASWSSLSESIRNLPPLSVNGVLVYSGPEIVDPIQIQPITEDMLVTPDRPASIDEAKERTDFAATQFIETYSSYSTILLVNFLLRKKEQRYDLRKILGAMETDYPELTQTCPREAFILTFKKAISEDPNIGVLKKFFFSSRFTLGFLYWTSNRLIKKTTRAVLNDVREKVQKFKNHETPTLNPDIAGFGMANKVLCRITNMFRSVTEGPSERLPIGSLEDIMDKISKDPCFWDGKTDAELKELVANKLVNEYLPRRTSCRDFLTWVDEKHWLLTPLKMLAIPLAIRDYISNKITNHLARKILNESDILTTLINGLKTKRGESTQIELTIYRAIRHQLVGVYKEISQPGQNRNRNIEVSEDTVKEIQSLCHQLVKVKHLRDLKDVDAVRNYFTSNPSVLENLEKTLIEQNGEIIGKLIYSIYKALLDDISVEVQFKSVLEAVNSSAINPPVTDEELKKQIAAEKKAIETLASVILRKTVDQTIDSFFNPQDLNSTIVKEIKGIVRLPSFTGGLSCVVNANNLLDKKGYAKQLNEQIIAARQQIAVLTHRLGQQSSNPSDENAERQYIQKVTTQLDHCQQASSRLMNACILQRMRTKPKDLFNLMKDSIEQVPADTNQKEYFARQLDRFKSILTTNRQSILEFSNGPHLIGSFEKLIKVFQRCAHSQTTQELQAARADFTPIIQSFLEDLEQSPFQTDPETISNEIDEVSRLLTTYFSNESELSRLLEERVEAQQLAIHLIPKNSGIARFAKNQIAVALDRYMKGAIPLLRDPLIFSVGIGTVLDEFVQ